MKDTLAAELADCLQRTRPKLFGILVTLIEAGEQPEAIIKRTDHYGRRSPLVADLIAATVQHLASQSGGGKLLGTPGTNKSPLRTVDTLGAVNDLLALAKEIADVEGLSFQEGLRRALAELPRLANDVHQNRRYAPKQPRTQLGQMRYRPVK
jgi:hypothetical protein